MQFKHPTLMYNQTSRRCRAFQQTASAISFIQSSAMRHLTSLLYCAIQAAFFTAQVNQQALLWQLIICRCYAIQLAIAIDN